jgi:hypothetical protein
MPPVFTTTFLLNYYYLLFVNSFKKHISIFQLPTRLFAVGNVNVINIHVKVF